MEIRPEIDWQELRGFGRVYPAPVEKTEDEEAELKRLRQEHDQLEALIESSEGDESAEAWLTEIVGRTNHLEREVYASDDLARAGAIVSVEHNGAAKFHRGYVHPEEAPSLDRSGSAKQNEAHAPAARGPTHSATLVEDLTAQRTAAIRLEFANNHHVALASVVHTLLLQTVLPYSRDHSCLEIALTSKPLAASMKVPQNSLGIAGLADLAERIGDHVPGNRADIFQWCLERDLHELVELLAFAAAHAIDAVQDKYDFRKTQRAHGEVLAKALNLDMTEYFEATAESYFNHLTRDGIEAALTEIKGPDFASGIARMKKAEAAAYAQVQTKGTAWLPAPLRSATTLREEAGNAALGSDDDEDAGGDDATDVIDDDTEADDEMDTFSEAAE